MSVRTSSSGHHSTTRRTGTPPSRSPARAASSRYPLRSPRRAGCLQLRPRPRTPQQHDGGLLGGRLRIESARGSGTQLIAELPLGAEKGRAK